MSSIFFDRFWPFLVSLPTSPTAALEELKSNQTQWRPDQVGHWGTCPSGATLIKGRQKTGGAKMIDAHFFLCVKIQTYDF